MDRIRSRLASVVRYGSLPLVMPLFDYCDVAKLNYLIERIHSKFINKLPMTYRSKFPFTLTERRRFHTAIQIFKSLHQISPP